MAANGGLDQRGGRNSGQIHARPGQQQNQTQKPQNAEEHAKIIPADRESIGSNDESSPSRPSGEIAKDEAVPEQSEAESSPTQ